MQERWWSCWDRCTLVGVWQWRFLNIAVHINFSKLLILPLPTVCVCRFGTLKHVPGNQIVFLPSELPETAENLNTILLTTKLEVL
jgi:hypothetical protein